MKKPLNLGFIRLAAGGSLFRFCYKMPRRSDSDFLGVIRVVPDASAGGPGHRPSAQNVEVEMINGLSAISSCIDHHPVAVG